MGLQTEEESKMSILLLAMADTQLEHIYLQIEELTCASKSIYRKVHLLKHMYL